MHQVQQLQYLGVGNASIQRMNDQVLSGTLQPAVLDQQIASALVNNRAPAAAAAANRLGPGL